MITGVSLLKYGLIDPANLGSGVGSTFQNYRTCVGACFHRTTLERAHYSFRQGVHQVRIDFLSYRIFALCSTDRFRGTSALTVYMQMKSTLTAGKSPDERNG